MDAVVVVVWAVSVVPAAGRLYSVVEIDADESVIVIGVAIAYPTPQAAMLEPVGTLVP